MTRRGPLALLALLGLAAAPAPEFEPSSALPDALPPPSVLVGWQQIDGAGEYRGESVRYRLYVDPAQPYLYRITQFQRRRQERPPNGAARVTVDRQVVIWNERPGLRVPLLCFRLEPAPGPLGDAVSWVWRPVPPGTPDYQRQMVDAMGIYQLQGARDSVSPREAGR